MQYQLSCDQVGALMAFYIEEKLSDKLSRYVEKHLEKCPSCMQKYEAMKNIIHKYTNLRKEIKEQEVSEVVSPYVTRQYEDFKANISAYIDNELSDEENIKIKKITISNPIARQDLEDMYTFKKLLHSSFEKTRNEVREDYSRYVLSMIQSGEEKKEVDPFFKIITIFSIMIVTVVAGVIAMLYF